MKYFKDSKNNLFFNPIEKNHAGLIALTELEFKSQLDLNNRPTAQEAIEQAKALYKTLKAKRVIDGYDLSDTFEFGFQRRKGGSVRMEKKGGKTETKTKAQADAIEGKLFAYLTSCADALDLDIDAINDSGDFSLTNLKAL